VGGFSQIICKKFTELKFW